MSGKNAAPKLINSTVKVEGPIGIVPDGEALYEANLMMIASQLTFTLAMCSSKKPEQPEELVEIFARMHTLLQSWYTAAPQKEQLQEMLEKVLPKGDFFQVPTIEGI